MRKMSLISLSLTLGALALLLEGGTLVAKPIHLSQKNEQLSQNLFSGKKGSKGSKGSRGHRGHKGNRGKRGHTGEDAVQGHFWGVRVDPVGSVIANDAFLDFFINPPETPTLQGFTTSSSTSSATSYDTITSNLGHGIYELIFNVQGNDGNVSSPGPAAPFNLILNDTPCRCFFRPGLATATGSGNGNFSFTRIINTKNLGLTLPIKIQIQNRSGSPITVQSTASISNQYEPSATFSIKKIG